MAEIEFLSLTPPPVYQDGRPSPIGLETQADQDVELDVDCIPFQTAFLERNYLALSTAIIPLKLPSDLVRDYDRLSHAWHILARHNHVVRTIIVKEVDVLGGVMFRQRILKSPRPITMGHLDDAKLPPVSHEPASLVVDWYKDPTAVFLRIQAALVDRTSLTYLWKDFVSILTGGIPISRLAYPKYAATLNRRETKAAKEFWSESLQDVPALVLHSIPIARQGSLTTTPLITSAAVSSVALKRFCGDLDVSQESLLYTALGIVLNRHCQTSSDTAIFVVEGRDATVDGYDTVVGCVDQQYPLKLQLSPGLSVAQGVRYTEQVNISSSSNAYIGYDSITSEYPAARSDFRIIFSELDEALEPVGDHFPVTIYIRTAETVSISARHDTGIPKEKAEIILDHLMTAIANMLAHPTALLSEISIISSREKALIHKMGMPKTKPAPGSVHQIFEKQVELTPNVPAAQFERDAPISYVELNRMANRVARQLPAARGSFVPVCVERSVNLIVALVSILKTGAAYVTLDPETPQDRNMFIISDVNADFVIVDRSVAGRFPNEIIIEDLLESSRRVKDTNLTRFCEPSDPVYVIYTSGSTGKPKGVLHLHSSATSGLDAFPMLPHLRQLLFHNPVFSAAQRSVWSTLKQGGCLCLASKDNLTLHIGQTINQMRINVIDVTPSTALLIKPGTVPCLRRMTVAGELINPALIPMWVDHLELLNAYGLSENTQVNWRREMVLGQNPQNIGRPSDTTTSFVLVPGSTELTPLLVPGELCLGGDQLAVYYINRPEKTAEAFITNPFGPGRLYRTGDMVVAHEDGSIEMLGRIDFQVKINGQRVEPGDSNSVIQTHPDVYTSSVVSADIDGRKVLVAVVVPKGDTEWSQLRSELRDLLKLHIPSYMMPTYWLPEAELPLNINGKVDVPVLSRYVEGLGKDHLLEFSAKTKRGGDGADMFSPVARELRNIWAQVLNLPVDRISSADFFQELGGSSLDAIRVASQAHEAGLDIAVTDILRLPLREVAKHGKHEEHTNEVVAFSLLPEKIKLKLQDLEDAFPTTPLQDAFLADSLIGNSTYVYRRYYRMAGRTSEEIHAALQKMVKTHPVLRTSFLQNKTSFLQIIRKAAELSWEKLDVTAEEFSALEKHSMQLGENFVHFATLRGGVLAVSMHHALFDYWSNNYLIEDLEAGLQSRSLVKRPSPARFIEYMQEQDHAQMEEFWKSRLQHAVPSLLGHQSTKNTVVEGDVSEDLQTFAALHRVSLGSLVYAAWAIVLSLHTSQSEVIFGATLSGRDAPVSGILDMASPTINTVPFRVQVDPDLTALEFSKRIQEDLWQHSAPALLGLRNILRTSGTKAGLYDTLVNILIKDSTKSGDELFEKVLNPCSPEEPNYVDSTMLEAESLPTGVRLRLLSSLPEEKASLILGNVIETLKASFHVPEGLISQINPITLQEEVFVDSLSQEQPTTKGLLAHTLFEQMATRFPTKTALRDLSSNTLTYQQFDEVTSNLAQFLTGKGVQSGDIVPICMQKSLNTLIAVFGILKAGAAFTPLDPKNPRDRNDFIIGDVGARLAITDRVHEALFDSFAGQVINMDGIGTLKASNDSVAASTATPSALAYVIYTSGSTGLPKGVQVSHGAVAASTEGMIEACKVDHDWHALWFLNYVFDASYFDVFTVLGCGGTICVAPQDTLINDLAGCVRTFEAKQLMITPSISKLISPDEVPSLKALLVCGEPITPELGTTWASRMDVYNGYGPTEATILMTVSKVLPEGNLKSIGYPLRAIKASILHTDRLEPVPYGTVGELCVSGGQVAMGYLNRPDITATSFIKTSDGSVLYRTGDYARWLANGEIECLGRKDNQIKLNGYRIELGEIENTILAHASDVVKSCVVSLVTVQRKPAIVAYYVPQDTPELLAKKDEHYEEDDKHMFPTAVIDPAIIRTRITSLAHYMEPKLFLPFRSFPSLPSGKINRKVLKSIAGSLNAGDIAKYSGISSPRATNESESTELTETETILRNAWSELFDIEAADISASDLFSSHGGDSIGAINLVSILRRQSWSLSVNDALSYPSLREQARYVKASKSTTGHNPLADFVVDPAVHQKLEAAGLASEDIEEIYPCAPGQVEFLTQGHTNDQFWQLMTVRRLPPSFDFDLWIDLTRKLTAANQILRAMYMKQVDADQLSWVQVILKEPVLDLEIVECSSENEKDNLVRRHWDQHFEIGKPFVRYLVLRYEDGTIDLCTKLDHAMYDGTLLRVFDDQFTALRQGTELPKSVPFKAFIEYNSQKDERGRMLSFWRDHLANNTFNYPSHIEGPKVGGALVKKLNLDVATYAQTAGVTPSIVFQTAYTLLLSRLSGETDITYDYLLTGRNVDMDDPQLINGTCANFLPFRSRFDRSTTEMNTLLRETQNGFWQMTENGLVSLGDIYKALGVDRRRTAAKTLFLYQPFEPAQGEQDHMRWIVMAMSKVTMFVNYSIMFEVFKDVQGNKLKLQYDARLFSEQAAGTVMDTYMEIVTRLVKENPVTAGQLL
ncbi:hypothetical protein BKA67DRAFT_591458 [Truncatella angustata]|uniref:Carrier domain-containing protein n=1 Tax=Truncatella angustata TaxID=152316 RepID=A0A9P8UUD3_9PEZI|nr:uncharacterized protein BKA67DRAFT_591458 [Truncatella angustata]KAH6658496.1 hypothetical protein BKA67DRAFT_591458 [Truncatella angustata]